MKAITLSSGKKVKTRAERVHDTKEKGPVVQDIPSKAKSADKKEGIPPPPQQEEVYEYKSCIPYPKRLK